ncbi:MAG: helix-turn-helix transcriptional regulator [Armatimonadetes bacterium]|nr:helix-turn-helix transcriptional regulator [Armatimonadota bacterium]
MAGHRSEAETGRRLRSAAHEMGLTLRDLGDKMGVSRPTIYAYASGALKMSEERLHQAAQILGKPVGYFDPKNIEGPEGWVSPLHSLRLIEAMMSPASPSKASDAAREALESLRPNEPPAVRAELLRRSGNALTMAGDYVSAIGQLEIAIQIFQSERDFEKVGQCAQTLGFCYTNLGQIELARKAFAQAKTHLGPASQWKADVALAALAERIGDFDEAERLLSALLDDAGLPDSAVAYIRANFASIVCARGRWRSGFAQTETALTAAYTAGLTDQVAELLIQGAFALTHLGRLEEATLMVTRARDVTFTLQDKARSTLADVAAATVLAGFGQEGPARELLVDAHARATKNQYRRSESAALLLQAELALKRGEVDSAYEWALQATSHAEANNYVVAASLGRCLQVQALASLGRLELAADELATVSKKVAELGEGRPAVLCEEARGDLAAQNMELDQAAETFCAAMEMAEDAGLRLDFERLARKMSALTTNDLESTTRPTHETLADKWASNFAAGSQAWTNLLLGESLLIDPNSTLSRRNH